METQTMRKVSGLRITKAMNAVLMALLVLMLASPVLGTQGVLDRYIGEALRENLALKQREFAYEKARSDLAEARSLFMPSVSLQSRYSRAGGGRSIEVPIGDLVNPIHEALNDLIGAPAFPANLPNVTTPFLREEEQETKLQLVQPIFEPSIYFNYKIRSRLEAAEHAARDAYVQELVKEVKTAYFNYLKTEKIVELYEQTEVLLQENLRVSRSLFENGKATGDVVFRARAELSQLEQDKADAGKTRNLARSYFNFLLGRSLDEMVKIDEVDSLPAGYAGTLSEAQELALANRHELVQLRMAVEAAKHSVRLSRSGYLPSLAFAFDYGYQGEEYSFTDEDDYWMGSVVLSWNLFDGLGREARTGQAQAEHRRLEAQLAELKEAIRLQVVEAYDNLAVAEKSLAAARDRLVSSEKSFDIVSRKYTEGMAAQIEYLDAQTTMTQARINLIVTTYDYHIRDTELERALASVRLPAEASY
jgi:outer membrane protein TolC